MERDHLGLAEKKIGLTCSYIPEELIIAAQMEPVQIRGLVGEGKHSLSYTCANMCPYVENLLDSGLSRRFDDLSGIIFADSCDCMRRLHDLWNIYVKTPFCYMLEIPKNQGPEGVAYFIDRLFDLKQVLESNFKSTISEHDLTNAISLVDNRRKIMMDIMDGQKEIPPRFNGRELFSAFVSDSKITKSAVGMNINYLADEQVHALHEEREKPRLMAISGRINGDHLFEMVEKAGGTIVVPDYCNGLKNFSRRVDAALPPIEAIARGYLNGPACPRMQNFEGRLERIRHLIYEYKINGLVYHRFKNCDYGMFETPQLEKFAQTIGIPFLAIETDYLWHDAGRIRTRIEAFLEMLIKDGNNSS